MDKKVCFFVTPIGEEGTDIRERSDTVVEYLLKPVCDELGFEVIRIDLVH